VSTSHDRTVATWPELEAELPGLAALTADNADDVAQLAERLGNGQRALEEALRRGSGTTKIDARIEEIRGLIRAKDSCWRRLALIRGMLVLRNVAGRDPVAGWDSKISVVTRDMEIVARPGPPA